MNALFSILMALSGPVSASDGRFIDLQINNSFRHYIFSNPLLMETTGAKLIQRKDGYTIIISIASTVLKNDSSMEMLRAERVCRIKALASVVSEKEGVQIFHMETLTETAKITAKGTEESGESVSEFLKITQAKVEGITKDMPVVGRWKSKEGDVFFLALGAIVDPKGVPIPLPEDTE